MGDLSYLRNAMVYVNRNGFVVNNDVTPFSYPWGSSPYFFQPMAVRYAGVAGKAIGNTMLRAIMHNKACDKFSYLKMVDGYVSPLEFLDIDTSESVFRDEKHFFYLISRKIEAYSDALGYTWLNGNNLRYSGETLGHPLLTIDAAPCLAV